MEEYLGIAERHDLDCPCTTTYQCEVLTGMGLWTTYKLRSIYALNGTISGPPRAESDA